jgi:hypothetical protein
MDRTMEEVMIQELIQELWIGRVNSGVMDRTIRCNDHQSITRINHSYLAAESA